MDRKIDRFMTEISQSFFSLYGKDVHALKKLETILFNAMNEAKQGSEPGTTQWLNDGNTVGMMLYVDLFSGNLMLLLDKLPYFQALGVTLIHLMPILEKRQGENDGGFAVKNFRAVDPSIGDIETLKKVIQVFHKKGIRICLDFVINHTADDHEWAIKALEGDSYYQNFYFLYEDKQIPEIYEKTVPEVFPKVAPGNFTYNEKIKKYILTTFYPYQWDLNYSNPEVFLEMIDTLMHFGNLGVDMIRLDAIPFIWKELGTPCRNHQKVHTVLNLFRQISEFIFPGVALLGEAIMSPETIVTYFGSREEPECHILYNASFMVEIWNALATRDARHLSFMKAYSTPPKSNWINYARCHDDIGWGIDEDKTRQLGFDPLSHKLFLIDFYSGGIKESYALGELYEFDPVTLDARNSGTLASLAGLEKAIVSRDYYQTELAVKRIELIYLMILFKKGLPMLYMGDEFGMLNQYEYKEDLKKAHDSRWLHRGQYKWQSGKEMPHLLEIQEKLFEKLSTFIQLRKSAFMKGEPKEEVRIQLDNAHVYAYYIRFENNCNPLLVLANFSEDRQWVYTTEIKRYGFAGKLRDIHQGKILSLLEETILLGPYEVLLLNKF